MLTCPTCGRENPEGFAFCGYCRAPLAPDAASADVRKTVTILFCDVTGSTSLAEQLDPESMRKVMSRFFEEMRGVLERHGGTVEKFIGDAVMAVFGIPAVHEDDALRAVRAAAEMRDALATLNEGLERDLGVTIATRIGMNTGGVVAGDPSTGQTLVTGDVVNVAARLQQAATPGQILLGETTRRLVRDAATTEEIQPLTLKGKTEPVPAYALLHVLPQAAELARHRDSAMVGRKQELDALHEALGRATRDRRCIRVTVLGAPGVGKSRLVDEFVAVHEDDAVVTHGRCLSYGEGITYWPVVEILTAVAEIAEVDGPDEIRSKIGRVLDGSGDAAIAVERLAELLGLSGATAAAEETHWAVRKLFEALATRRPLAVVFEDVHWAEPALLDLIEHVMTVSRDAPIVLLCTGRPELLEERPDWAIFGTTAISLPLEPLTQDESDELIANLIGPSALPAEAGSIVDAADGNPLFLEQLVGMLIDDGHLRHDGDAWAVAGDLSSLSIPPTLKGILEARLERLSAPERHALERGAAEGRVFHRASVTAMSDTALPADIGRDLRSLVRRELIEPVPALFGSGEAFRFRHALIRDAAYTRLPKSARADLHEGHARWLERTAGHRVAEFEDVLAYHLEQATLMRADLGPLDEAGRELGAEAARRLASSGRRASARGDVRAASNLLDRAITLLPPADPGRAELLVRFGEAVAETGDQARAGLAFDEARALAARLGDVRVEIRARLEGARFKLSFDPEGATDELDRLIQEAVPTLEALGDDEGLAVAWRAAGQVDYARGRADGMVASLERASMHAERTTDQVALSETLCWLIAGTVVGTMPPEEVIRGIHEIRERRPQDRQLEAVAAVHEAMALAMLGRPDEGRRLYRYGHGILEDLGMTLWAAGTRYAAGYIEMLEGDLVAAESEFRRGIDGLRSMGDSGFLSSQAAELGQVLYEQGRLDEAEEMVGLAKRSGASDDISTQVPWRGVQAKILARRGEFAPAIALVGEAVAMTEGSDYVENRAGSLMDLAEVHMLAGEADDAATALREALEILEEKGVVPLVERIRARLEDLERPAAR